MRLAIRGAIPSIGWRDDHLGLDRGAAFFASVIAALSWSRIF